MSTLLSIVPAVHFDNRAECHRSYASTAFPEDAAAELAEFFDATDREPTPEEEEANYRAWIAREVEDAQNTVNGIQAAMDPAWRTLDRYTRRNVNCADAQRRIGRMDRVMGGFHAALFDARARLAELLSV